MDKHTHIFDICLSPQLMGAFIPLCTMCQLESWEKMKSVFTCLSMNSKDFALRNQSHQKQLHRAWLCCAYIFTVQRYMYSVIDERWRDKEKAEEKVISGAVNLWGLKVFIKNWWEECMTTTLSLSLPLCFCAFLPLSLSLSATHLWDLHILRLDRLYLRTLPN